MNRFSIVMFFLSFFIFFSCVNNSEKVSLKKSKEKKTKENQLPIEVIKLLKNYPQIKEYKNNYLVFLDGDSLLFDDKIKKNTNQLINNPSIKDIFYSTYEKGERYTIKRNKDPGRYRNDLFFKKIYGATKDEVQDSLVRVIWCPKTVNQVIYVTKINEIDKRIKRISNILDEKPHLTKYVNKIGGTFNWRKINKTDRQSMHSYGMTIDLNVEHSDYWQWNCKCSDEDAVIVYENKIPIEIVQIFENEGFIWGGKWYHYDTMHFEYRPELLNN